MSEANRSLSALFVIGVAVAAIAGYLLGAKGSGTGGAGHAALPAAQIAPAYAAGVQLETPANWRAAATVPAIAGLQLARPVVLAPGGDAASAGLIAGELPSGEPSPLPASFLARLPDLPKTAVVGLSRTEAYRYTDVIVPGFQRPLTLYAIPNLGGDSTILACYATAAAASSMSACEQIVLTLRPIGQNGSGNLAPDAVYARAVSAAVGALDQQRVQTRSEMQDAGTPATVRTLAARLGHDFAVAESALGRLEPPLVAGQAQAALIRALLGAREAYEALATTAGAESLTGYEAARARVTTGEAGVTTALQSFALLGYGRG